MNSEIPRRKCNYETCGDAPHPPSTTYTDSRLYSKRRDFGLAVWWLACQTPRTAGSSPGGSTFSACATDPWCDFPVNCWFAAIAKPAVAGLIKMLRSASVITHQARELYVSGKLIEISYLLRASRAQ